MKKTIKIVLGIVLAMCTLLASSVSTTAYTVKPGDTLNAIAKANETTVKEILKMNPSIKNKDKIHPGQEIEIGNDFYHRAVLSDSDKKTIETMFDSEYYRKNNPDVVAMLGDSKEVLFNHFLRYGLWETRQPNENFNVNAYASAYNDLRDAFVSDDLGEMVKSLTLHYALFGKNEGRTETTINACINAGKDVLYYGAFDNETNVTEQEHVIATVPVPETKLTLTFAEVCQKQILEWLYDVDKIYVDNALVDNATYFYGAKEVYEANKTVENLDEWVRIAFTREGTIFGGDNTTARNQLADLFEIIEIRSIEIINSLLSGDYSDWDALKPMFADCPVSALTDAASISAFSDWGENDVEFRELVSYADEGWTFNCIGHIFAFTNFGIAYLASYLRSTN